MTLEAVHVEGGRQGFAQLSPGGCAFTLLRDNYSTSRQSGLLGAPATVWY